MRNAFKEWAVIVDALGRGEQIVILRKGGIHEGRGGFGMDHERFWLFPTRYHQQGESVLPDAAADCADVVSSLPPEDILRLEYFCETAEWRKLESAEAARSLKGQHVWKDEVIDQRYEWGREKGLYALAARVFKLLEPVDAPMLDAYGGCKSWIELDGEFATDGAAPVLTDEAFQEKLAAFRKALDAAAVTP